MKRFILLLLLSLGLALAIRYRVDTSGGAPELSDQVRAAFATWLELDSTLDIRNVDEAGNETEVIPGEATVNTAEDGAAEAETEAPEDTTEEAADENPDAEASSEDSEAEDTADETSDAEDPDTENPDTENPDTENPDTENSEQAPEEADAAEEDADVQDETAEEIDGVDEAEEDDGFGEAQDEGTVIASDDTLAVFRYGDALLFGPDTLTLTFQQQLPDRSLEILVNPAATAERESSLLHEAGRLLGLRVSDSGVMNPAVTAEVPTLGAEEAAALETEQSALAQDVNRDGEVDFYDLVELAKAFGQTGVGSQGDINEDGIVDEDDLDALREAYTFSEPAETAPTAEETDPLVEDILGEEDASNEEFDPEAPLDEDELEETTDPDAPEAPEPPADEESEEGEATPDNPPPPIEDPEDSAGDDGADDNDASDPEDQPSEPPADGDS